MHPAVLAVPPTFKWAPRPRSRGTCPGQSHVVVLPTGALHQALQIPGVTSHPYHPAGHHTSGTGRRRHPQTRRPHIEGELVGVVWRRAEVVPQPIQPKATRPPARMRYCVSLSAGGILVSESDPLIVTVIGAASGSRVQFSPIARGTTSSKFLATPNITRPRTVVRPTFESTRPTARARASGPSSRRARRGPAGPPTTASRRSAHY